MIIQVINMSHKEVNQNFTKKYNYFPVESCNRNIVFEVRGIPSLEKDSFFRFLESENELFFKHENGYFTDILIHSTIEKINLLINNCINSEKSEVGFKLQDAFNKYLNYDSLKIYFDGSEKNFAFPLIMGILNVTPDSFSDGGKFFEKEKAIEKALLMIEEGADIIDIGGESTRPGAEPVSVEEELRRVIPVINEITKNNSEILISIDTTKSKVAEEALNAGATLINDISGLTFDTQMISTAKKFNAGVIIMHIKGTPKNMQENPYYTNVVSDIYDFLYKQTESAKRAGIKNIFIDPGIGFGKRGEDNTEIIKRLRDFASLGFPIVIGLSRKSFLSKLLDIEIEERDISTVIAESFALQNGAKIIRTHNVKNAKYLKSLKMYFS